MVNARIKRECKGAHKISSIAAHVPDLVVYSTLNQIPYTEHFNGVLLFADVSGFTNLMEIYSRSQKGYGADEFTRILNSYIGDIVSHILASGGDVLNYAGDAVLALWMVERMQLSDVISVAVKCSLNIQDQCGVRETSMGCQLRVKIGISAGKLSKAIVGDEVSQYFVVIGRAVDEVRLAEGLALASTIILSPNAWELCDRDNIVVERIENERAVKIDDDQPLEYLSEMRPATIVFINLQFRGGESDPQQCRAIHQAAIGIGQLTLRHHGRVNKVFMFDKGCTFLCLFGLPGDKREDESAHALQAAYGIHELCLREIRSLRTVSVGVTTGPVFCGVVGHPVRHEYTVIGRKVNLAARLMMHYPGVVSCDNETCYYSKLPSLYFSELPQRAMKGVQNPGTIHRFMGRRQQITIGKSPMSVEREEGYPLIGREKEMETFSRVLKGFLDARRAGHRDYTNVVVCEAAIGYGKSRLLAECVYRAAQEGARVISFELAKTDIKQSQYTLQTLLALLLSVQKSHGYAEREREILSQITDPHARQSLCLLNALLMVKFPVSETVSLMDSQRKSEEMTKFFLQLFCKFADEQPCVYVIDQAHYVDQASWGFLAEACSRAPVLLLLAVAPLTGHSSRPSPGLLRLGALPRSLVLRLPALEPPAVAQLACQVLGVPRIPSEVELFLVERSHGVPYYCEELLKSLYLGQMIVIEEQEEEEEEEEQECEDVHLLFPEPTLVEVPSKHSQDGQEDHGRTGGTGPPKSTVLKSRKITTLDECGLAERTLVCRVGKAVKLHQIPIPLTLKGMALAHLDHLRPAEQMVVKCAAIIGASFTRRMLAHIVPEASERKLQRSLASLFRSGTFECGSAQFAQQGAEQGSGGGVSCYCPQERQDGLRTGPVGVASSEGEGAWPCQLMRFCTSLVKETAYELWLKEQKREIHRKCADFLLTQPHRCPDCAIDEFIPGHKAALGNGIIGIQPDAINTQDSADALFPGRGLAQGLHTDVPPLNQVQPMLPNSEAQDFLSRLDGVVEACEAAGGRGLGGRGQRCRCARLAECVLGPMVRHCMGVGDVSRTFYYLLETAAASVYLSNNLKALSYLNEANIILDNLKAGKPAFETADPKVRVRISAFERACVFRLQGQVLYNTGQIREAERMFLSALKLLSRPLPQNRLAVSLKLLLEKMRTLHYGTRTFHSPGEKKLAFLQEQILCLSFLWQISCMRGAHSNLHSNLTISMQRNCARQSAMEDKIISSSIDYLQYCQVRGREAECGRYERLLCGTCGALPHNAEGLALLCHFLCTLATVKLCSGDLLQSIQFGSRAQRINKLTNRPGLDMWVINVFHTPLLLTQRYQDCVQLILSLESLSSRTRVGTARGWFYAACLQILLYAGFALRPFSECLSFVEESQSSPALLADKSLMMTLHSALALWYTRLCEWDRARLFYTRACGVSPQVPGSVHSGSGLLMFLECSVLLLRKALVERNKRTTAIYQRTQERFRSFSLRFSSTQLFLPRMLHLRAYLTLLSGREAPGRAGLSRALDTARRHGNALEQSWVTLTESSWFAPPQGQTADWRVSVLRMPSWEQAQAMGLEGLDSTRYTLPGLDSTRYTLPGLDSTRYALPGLDSTRYTLPGLDPEARGGAEARGRADPGLLPPTPREGDAAMF